MWIVRLDDSWCQNVIMTWKCKNARDIPQGNKLRCHIMRDCKIVIRLICDIGWYGSDFNQRVSGRKGFYITNNLIVYVSAHGNLNYNVLEDHQYENVKITIINRKMKLLTK